MPYNSLAGRHKQGGEKWVTTLIFCVHLQPDRPFVWIKIPRSLVSPQEPQSCHCLLFIQINNFRRVLISIIYHPPYASAQYPRKFVLLNQLTFIHWFASVLQLFTTAIKQSETSNGTAGDLAKLNNQRVNEAWLLYESKIMFAVSTVDNVLVVT